MINEKIFREYDIRGIADTDLTDDVVYTIGKSYGSYVQEKGNYKVIIGHDNRQSSERINNQLIKGLVSTGIGVIDLGLVTTPMLYFARKYYNIDTSIMITASHNPKEYNGFKISFTKIGTAYGKFITDFKDYTIKGNFKEGNGNLIKASIEKEYLENIKESINLGKRKVKVVVDLGNGTGCIIAKKVLDLFDIQYEFLYDVSDSTFPNHIADPAVSSNMIDLGKRVRQLNYDFGIGIDGDADRVGIVDENGNYVKTDMLMLMVYQNIYKTMKNKKSLFDVKCSRTLIEGLKPLKLEPIMNRTGSSYCNLAMQEDDIDFGGEYSGHLFFKDHGFDDGLYSALKIIEIFSKNDKKFSELLPKNPYYSTEEEKVEVTEEAKFKIVEEVKKYALSKGYELIDIDGIRVEFIDGWALVRASNTGPNLTVRFEAKTNERLKEIKNEFMDVIKHQISLN